MVIEKKTIIYILIGLVYICGAIAIQGGWSNMNRMNYLLFGEYDSNSYPDLYVGEMSEGASYGDHFNFIYSGYYIDEIYALGDKSKLHKGVILLRPNNNYIQKKYSSIPSGSKVSIKAYNDAEQNNSQDNYCESIKMIVKQDGTELETLNIENINKPKKYDLTPQTSNSESNFILKVKSNPECDKTRQSLGVDKFYLDKNYEPN